MNSLLEVNRNSTSSPARLEIFRQWLRIKAWIPRLIEFGFVQGLVQLLTAAAGLLIVRTMSKPEYALYAIANSMQITANMLADLGVGIGVTCIGGRVWSDRERFGQLVNTALTLRHRFACISVPVALPLTVWMLWRNGASWSLVLVICLLVTAGLIPLLQSTVFTVALRLHSQYRRIQKLDLGTAGLRFGLIAGLALTRMSALLALLAGVAGNWFQMVFAASWVRENADSKALPNPLDQLELIHLSHKWIPNVIFACFQGQVTLLILTLRGTPTGIADITALSRIAVLFAVFSSTFSSVLAPRFARCQEPAQYPRLYLLLIGGTAAVLMPITVLAWFLPGPFLWLLGDKYANLGHACGLVVATGCVSQLVSVMWSLNSSKAWIRVKSFFFIPAILGTQLLATFWLNLAQFEGVVKFNLLTTAAPLPLYILDAVRGMNRSGRT